MQTAFAQASELESSLTREQLILTYRHRAVKLKNGLISGADKTGIEGVKRPSITLESGGEVKMALSTNWKVDGRFVIMQARPVGAMNRKFVEEMRDIMRTERFEIILFGDTPENEAVRRLRSRGYLKKSESRITGTL